MMLLELAYEIETIAALATLVVDVGARALYLDGTTFETGKIGTALLGLFGVQQRTATGVSALDLVMSAGELRRSGERPADRLL